MQMKLHRPSLRGKKEFLDCVKRSESLHHPWVYPPSTPLAFEEYLKRLRSVAQLGYWIRTEEGQLAGVFNVSEIVRGNFLSGYLGYYAFMPHENRGYMKRGLAAVVSNTFDYQGLHRLEANIQPGNKRSRALVQSTGFRLEGFSPTYLKIGDRWRDHERWAITVEDWTTLRQQHQA